MGARSRRAVLAALLVLAVAPVRCGREGVARPLVVPPADARAQLALARGLKGALRGLEGVPRERARARAVAAYREVRQRFPEARALGAEAAFRAAELLRSGGDFAGARRELARVLELDGGSVFAARAELELGHLERRLGRLGAALVHYEAVLFDEGAPRALRDAAGLWHGTVQAALGRASDARRLWERISRTAQSPLDRVRAADRIAASWIAAGDLEAAAGALERCRRELAERALERTEVGERLRRALAAMSSLRRLRAAVRARRETRSDDAPRCGEER